MTLTDDNYDPMAAAMEAESSPQTKNYFGRCVIDAWACVLVKGMKPQVYDKTQHAPEQRRTRIVMIFEPLPTSPFQNNITRELIAESKEWTETVRPSLKALGLELSGVHKQWVQYELVTTRTYQKKDASGQPMVDDTGRPVMGNATLPRFLAVYNNLEECQAASDALFHRSAASGSDAPVPVSASASNELARQEAAKLLPALWAMAHKDIGKFSQDIAKMPQTAPYFDMTSPEVLALVGSN